MKAGFARAKITPPANTPMQGWGGRDAHLPLPEGIHDDLFVRALYLRDGNEEALILAFDLLFFSRENAERLKAALGRRLELLPRPRDRGKTAGENGPGSRLPNSTAASHLRTRPPSSSRG